MGKRMDDVELIKSLIITLEGLQDRDFDALDAFRKRSRMIIKKIFGESSHYLKELEGIRFAPNISPVPEDLETKVWVSGRKRAISLLEVMLEDLELSSSERPIKKETEKTIQPSRKVFIAHGHDEEMKQAVARTIEKIGLEPIILHEQPNEGRTIIEKFTDYSDVSFAIVLLSPDDDCYSKKSSEETKMGRHPFSLGCPPYR